MLPLEAGDGDVAAGDQDFRVLADAVDPEEQPAALVHPLGPDVLGNGVGDAGTVLDLDDPAVGFGVLHQVGGRGRAGPLALGGDVVHQIVDVADVAAGKDTRHGGLHVFIDHRAPGAGIQGDAGLLGQLVFGQQAHR